MEQRNRAGRRAEPWHKKSSTPPYILSAARYLPDSRIHVDVPSIYELRSRRIRRAVAPFPFAVESPSPNSTGETCSNEEEPDHGGHQLTLEVRNARREEERREANRWPEYSWLRTFPSRPCQDLRAFRGIFGGARLCAGASALGDTLADHVKS